MASTPQFPNLVQETSITTSTGQYTLAGAVTGYRTFSAVGDGNSVWYVAIGVNASTLVPNGDGYELNRGVYTASGTTLTRAETILSSNSNAAVNWSAGTRLIYPVMPGEYMSRFPTITETAITTGVTLTEYGKSYVCSGTSANYTVVLPTAVGNAGATISFRMAEGLTKLVTIDGASSETINGQTTRILWAGETCTLRSDNTNWQVLHGKSRPMAASMYMAASSQTIETGAGEIVLLDTTSVDNTALMANTSTHLLTILRPGYYTVSIQGLYAVATVAPTLMEVIALKNGTDIVAQGVMPGILTDYSAPNSVAGAVLLAAGDTLQLNALQNATAQSQTLLGASGAISTTYLAAVEVITW